jgi:hypothetical protein
MSAESPLERFFNKKSPKERKRKFIFLTQSFSQNGRRQEFVGKFLKGELPREYLAEISRKGEKITCDVV